MSFVSSDNGVGGIENIVGARVSRVFTFFKISKYREKVRDRKRV